MQTRTMGKTGLTTSVLGFGSGQIGGDELSDEQAGRLLNQILDLGVTFIDSARSYGAAEERIGRHLSHRRREFVLSTKGGYGATGVADWTAAAIERGIDEALVRLRTERIDIFHFHSCPLHMLQREELLAALEAAVAAGKVGVAAYSGENAELGWALGSGRFGALQCSLNLFDQASLRERLPRAAELGLAVVAKRPLANAVFALAEPPRGRDGELYWQRMRTMALPFSVDELPELALRFAAFSAGVSTAIVGTRNLEHIKRNIAAVEKGPLSAELYQQLRQSFDRYGADWGGHI